jgi:hypothetical protein
MPLATLFNLQWYGPASGAGVVGGSATIEAGLNAVASLDGDAAGVGIIVDADATRLIGQGGTSAGLSAAQTDVLARARLTATLSIGSRPSADDIAQAIWNTFPVDGNYSGADVMRIMFAALAGKVSGAGGGTITIRDAATDTQDRIVATVDSNGNRTAVTLDGSP